MDGVLIDLTETSTDTLKAVNGSYVRTITMTANSDGGNLAPATSDKYNIGTEQSHFLSINSLRWAYGSRYITWDSSSNIYPYSNNTVSLGTSSKQYKNIYGQNIYVNGTAVSSDRRLKEEIEPLDEKHVEFFKNLKPVSYQFKDGMKGFSNMDVVCLDMEGVLVPEIWIAFSEESGIPELRKTTRDEPDYDKLMRWRIGVLKEHGLGLKEIQDTISRIDPLPGAKEFLDALRAEAQVIIISDTFTQFAMPLMKKLGYPTLFCNTLEVAEDGEITGFKMRCEQSKLTTVRALQSMGFDTIAAGDSFNDLAMIRASRAGFLFRTTEQIKKDNPDLQAFEEFDDFLAAIKAELH